MAAESPEQQMAAMFGPILPQLFQQQQGTVSQAATPGQSSGQDASMTDATDGTPQKWAKTKDKGGAGKGNRDYQHSRNQWWQTSKTDKQQKDMEEIVLTMGRLIIRHEDELSQLRADRGYVLYLDTKNGILPNLLATSVQWKKIQEEDKSKLDKSLKAWSGRPAWKKHPGRGRLPRTPTGSR